MHGPFPKKFREFAPQFFEKTDFSAFFQNIGSLNFQMSLCSRYV
jgi:hypothetical protein